jgi:hypothetical protein
MPKPLFYTGTAFCLFIALSAATALLQQTGGAPFGFVAVHGLMLAATSSSAWAIVVALLAGGAAAAILVRMATLLAARHLFAAFAALFTVAAAMVSLSWVLLLQARMLMIARGGLGMLNEGMRPIGRELVEMHFAAVMMLGYFIAVSFLALRPYFRIQASRVLSVLVAFPLPLFLLILVQELFEGGTAIALPGATPASYVFVGVISLLFFAIAVHCIRHRHMFLETTNLRELLDTRVDHAARPGRPIGGVAFDS